MLAFLNNSSITLQTGTSTANGVDDNTSKFPPCVQASALKQMCTADLGSICQRTGHKCTCSLFSIKGQPNSARDATFKCLCARKKKWEWVRRDRDPSSVSSYCGPLISFSNFFNKTHFPLNSYHCHTWLWVRCQSAFPAIWAGIHEKTCAAGPVPEETEGLQWCFTT